MNNIELFESLLVVVVSFYLLWPLYSARVQLPLWVRWSCYLLLLLWAALVVLALPRWPRGLHLVTGSVAGVGLVALWLWRPAFGVSRGLPPGSLSPVDSLAALFVRDYYRRRAERHGTIFKMSQFHRLNICIVGLQQGHDLLRTHHEALTSSELPFSADLDNGFLRYMQQDLYARYGTVFRRALAAPLIDAVRPTIAATTRVRLLQLSDASASPAAAAGVQPQPYLEQIAYDGFMVALFGSDPSSPFYQRFTPLYRDFERHDIGRRLSAQTRQQLEMLRLAIVDYAGAGPLPNCALAELICLNDGLDRTSVDNLLYIMKIASENVAGLLLWLFYFLTDDDCWLERLRRTAEGASRQQWAAAIVSETLRLAQSEYLYRTVRTSFTFQGFRFPRGSLVRICVRESHQDAAAFPDPQRFDASRFVGRRYDRASFSPFGQPPHACNGVPLTYAIAGSVAAELADGFKLERTNGGGLTHGWRHWNHWRPSDDFRVRLTRLPGATQRSDQCAAAKT